MQALTIKALPAIRIIFKVPLPTRIKIPLALAINSSLKTGS
jgi:hypothetical protein